MADKYDGQGRREMTKEQKPIDPRGPNKVVPEKHEVFPGQNPPVGDHDKEDRERKNKKGRK